MTKKLEQLLNLPESQVVINEEVNLDKKEQIEITNEQKRAFRDIAEFDKISAALPAVKGLGKLADDELNSIADKAITAYDDLMDLGMNVESRYASRIFEVAGSMLKTGLDAKVAKLDKKLKMIDLQLKKERLDNEAKPKESDELINGEGYVVTDRNSLLEKLKNMDK